MSSDYFTAVLVFAVVVAALHATDLSCKTGTTLYHGRCYETLRPSPRCKQDPDFAAARQYCQAHGGNLASIHSQAQNDFIAELIKKDQQEQKKKNQCSQCPVAKKDYFYWIGLQLSHSATGAVAGASWTDSTTVNYGNPLSASFRPPFVTGAPEGTVGDNSVPGEMCPLGNEKGCVAIYGFGNTVGKWTDRDCNISHTQNVTCKCEPVVQQVENATEWLARHMRHSSSEEQVDQIDACRDEAALNGLICEYCPVGWTAFQGNCYLVLNPSSPPNFAQANASCVALGGQLASVHSAAENNFLAGLGGGYIGFIRDTLASPFHWTDASAVDYTQWHLATGEPRQDGLCTAMSGLGPGSWNGDWNDVSCASTVQAICELRN